MNPKVCLALMAAALVLLWAASPAHADGVVVPNAGGYVTAIDGITLNGTLYDVTFTSNVDNTFIAYALNSGTITGIITAIDSDLGSIPISDATGQYYGISSSAGAQGTPS